MCERCREEARRRFEAVGIREENGDAARVRELAETLGEIAKRNNWPIAVAGFTAETDGFRPVVVGCYGVEQLQTFIGMVLDHDMVQSAIRLAKVFGEHHELAQAMEGEKP